eukprot:scaffold21935_cov53-Attheya_sp.AAC.1
MTGVTLVNTVKDNSSNYTSRDYSRALLARKIQHIIGRPSTRTFMHIVEKNLLPNCPITRRDIVAAEAILGPDVGSLKGKTVRRKADAVNIKITDIPATIMSHYRDIIVGGDNMFINKIPFFVTISRHIKFCTAETLNNQTSKTLLTAIKNVKSIYMKRANASENDHRDGLLSQLFWLNSFPHPDGVSDSLSPRAIVVGNNIDYGEHCQLEFGTYVQTHEDHNNSMATRTTGALALYPTGNEQGGYFFLSLTSGRRSNQSNWTVLPIPEDVINRVHVLARRNNMPNGLAFADRDGIPLIDPDDDDSDDESWHPGDAEDSEDSEDENPDNENNEDSDSDEDPVPNENPIPIAGVNDVTNDVTNDIEVQHEPESENEPESEDEPKAKMMMSKMTLKMTLKMTSKKKNCLERQTRILQKPIPKSDRKTSSTTKDTSHSNKSRPSSKK